MISLGLGCRVELNQAEPSLFGSLLRLASSHAVQGFFVMILRISLGVISGSTSIQARSLIHLDITPDEGWPMRLWSQKTSWIIFELVEVLESLPLFEVDILSVMILSLRALCWIWLCVGFFAGICLSLAPGGCGG